MIVAGERSGFGQHPSHHWSNETCQSSASTVTEYVDAGICPI